VCAAFVAKAGAAMMMGSVFMPLPLLLQLDFEIVDLILQRRDTRISYWITDSGGETATVVFQWLSIATGLVAAGFWFWSACVRLPTAITSGWGSVGGIARFQVLADKLRAQGHISAAAATFSGLSVLCQALAPLLA